MTIYKKPEKTIFASAAKVGEVLDFPDRARGWGVTLDQTNAIPPMEWFNNLQQVNDESIQYLLQYGVAIKDNETEYPVNAITNENGELYICKKQHVNKPVSNATYWEKIRKEASKTQAGVVELSSSVTSTDETKASTLKATKTAYDKAVQADNNANNRVSKSGDTMTGHLAIKSGGYSAIKLYNKSNEHLNFSVTPEEIKEHFGEIVYRGSGGGNKNVIRIPKKDGILLLDVDTSNSTTSSSTATIATSLAVKKVYDKAVQNEKLINNSVQYGQTSVINGIDELLKKEDGIHYVKNIAPFYAGIVHVQSGIDDRNNAPAISRFKKYLAYSYDGNNYIAYSRNGSTDLIFRRVSLDIDKVGAIDMFASDKSKKGYLKCDGGLYSTTTYADLFKEIGYTWGGSGSRFAVPNLTDKARFLRSNSNKLKVGTYQNDAIRNITGYFGGEVNKNGGGLNGAFYTDYSLIPGRTLGDFTEDRKIIFDASRVVPTAEENRPYSAVVAYWIKY